jgi:site-specific DNA-methyltransferase (adenine-specific)
MAVKLNKIYNIDCLEGMKQIDDDTIDAIISDPPYQLSPTGKGLNQGSYDRYKRISAGFMGKEWDVLPSVEILKEALRVLKPGAFALWLMTPRQDSQLEFLLRLREAGFVIAFTPIYWVYASGFPKGLNISKAIDKKLGAEPKGLNISKAIDKKLGAERIPTGIDQKFGRADSGIYQMNVNGENKKKFIRYDIPASEEAKKMDGSYGGFQPKPAVEVVIVSMKPLSEKTYVDQALKNGKGVTWLDDCRIPISGEKVYIHNAPAGTFAGGEQNRGSFKDYRNNTQGRFPANLLVSDNVLDNGSKHSVGHNPNVKTVGYGSFGGGFSERVDWKEDTYIKDSGDLSRYFSLDAWWEQKVKELPEKLQKIFPFLYVPKASKNERNKGLENSSEIQNRHPTVKPIKLMSYLITLTTREGDVVLDPFIGSGTTAISSILLNRNFIGFEMDPEYFKIAEERIKYYQEQKKIIEIE